MALAAAQAVIPSGASLHRGSISIGSCSRQKTSFLPSQRATLRSSASISGRSNGFDFLFSHKMTNRRKAGCTVIKCEAAVAGKETPVEKYEYQAEVSRLMDLIVHSLYSHKEVFLRELVSNASDALNKLRFLSVTEPSLMDQNLEMRIKADKEAGTNTVSNTGIGMTRNELVESSGTIA